MARKSKNDGLSVRGLGKSYRKKVVLRDVNLDLKRGEVVALLGPNGAGKTTCFYSIAGIVSPSKGSVFVEGKDATQLPMYRRAHLGLGYLPQEPSIFRGLSVEKNILSIAELWCENKESAKARTHQLMEEFTVTHLKDSPALALSGGERRRVEIARCLASDPSYVLLDEPFAGVDPIAVNDIRSLVSQLKRKKIGVLITDHNVRETLKIVDRAYILHDGMVMMSGTPKQVVANKDVRNVYLGQDFVA